MHCAGVALLSSIALIFTAIFVLQNSNRDDRDDRGNRGYSGGFGGGGFGYSYMWGPSPLDLFFYNSYQPYGINRYQDPQELSFLESVFSVLFGDGDPNANLEERRSKTVAQLIRAKGGAVTAEELAPYMDPGDAPPASDDLVDESYVRTPLPLCPPCVFSARFIYLSLTYTLYFSFCLFSCLHTGTCAHTIERAHSCVRTHARTHT